MNLILDSLKQKVNKFLKTFSKNKKRLLYWAIVTQNEQPFLII